VSYLPLRLPDNPSVSIVFTIVLYSLWIYSWNLSIPIFWCTASVMAWCMAIISFSSKIPFPKRVSFAIVASYLSLLIEFFILLFTVICRKCKIAKVLVFFLSINATALKRSMSQYFILQSISYCCHFFYSRIVSTIIASCVQQFENIIKLGSAPYLTKQKG
jgi:hypothetical protein